MAESINSSESENCIAEFDYISDFDLPSGSPSPDASDDEEIQKCSDHGIVTPYFLNKLRELTKPLFHASQKFPSVGLTNQDTTTERARTFRTKKRNVRDNGSESALGIIERYYGYIPNPRWPKVQSYSRPFNPKDLGKDKKPSIPGIVFRERSERDHSYRENDFPVLSSSNKDDSHSFHEVNNSGDTSMTMFKMNSPGRSLPDRSPVTSTPLRGVMPSGNSPLESCPAAWDVAASNKNDSNLDEPCQIKIENRSKSGRNNRRRSKKISSPLVGTPLRQPEQNCSDVSDFNSSNSFLTHQKSGDLTSELSLSGRSYDDFGLEKHQCSLCKSKNDCSCQSVSSSALTQTSFSESSEQALLDEKSKTRNKIPKGSFGSGEKLGINNNIIKSPTWSQVASRTSSPVSWNTSDERSMLLVQSPLTIDTRPASPSWSQVIKAKASPVLSPSGTHCVKYKREVTCENEKQMKTVNDKMTKNGLNKKFTPVNGIIHKNSSLSETYKSNSRRNSFSKCQSKPLTIDVPEESPLPQPSHSSPQMLENNRQSKDSRRRGSLENSKAKNVSKQAKDSPSQSIPPPCNESKNSGKKGEKQRVKLLTLENFITPKKSSDKENWPNKCPKDLNVFEHRFVEQIEASATAPPKKIRPSPIKKINFSPSKDKDSSSEPNDKSENDMGDISPSKAPIYKRQMSIIRDLDWQKTNSNSGQCTSKGNRKNLHSGQSSRGSGVVFCLENYVANKHTQQKDSFEDMENNPVKENVATEKEVQEFWNMRAYGRQKCNHPEVRVAMPASNLIKPSLDDEEENIYNYFPRSSSSKINSFEQNVQAEVPDVITGDSVNPSHVTLKANLKKYARRYCHLIEEHQVASIADEITFILQLLTSFEVHRETLDDVDKKVGGTSFRSVHNSVYFAILVMKKLRRLFLCLPFPIIYHLAHNHRVKIFSPKLHACFMSALSSRKLETENVLMPQYHSFSPLENGIDTFPDTNFAHVFKCQRDNFFALYRQYHDRNGTHPFFMEEQIQYVYDSRTPEQNSITNMMHLADIYLQHLIECSLTRAEEQRKEIMDIMESQHGDEAEFEKLLSSFMYNHARTSSGTSSGQHLKVDPFFTDFIQTLRCPAFNEHLKNLIVSRIIELNGKSFGCVRNLHSTKILDDDKAPGRCHDFSSTVLSLCCMAIVLGHLVFTPYTFGVQDVPIYQEKIMLQMREMVHEKQWPLMTKQFISFLILKDRKTPDSIDVPLPLPLPFLLKQAFENGHLTLTIPWIVEFLVMMDQAAPKLSIFMNLLKRLKYLQRYAWNTLFMRGHHNSGMLIETAISKLFEISSIPSHLSFFSNDEHSSEPQVDYQEQMMHVDMQKLVSSWLLFCCCPCLVQSCASLTLFTMEKCCHRPSRKVVSLTPQFGSHIGSQGKLPRGEKNVEVIRQWLGASLQSHQMATHSFPNEDKGEESTNLPCVQRDIEINFPFPTLDEKIQNDLKRNFIEGTPYLRSIIRTSVDLLCGRVEGYALNMLLRVAAFETKKEVRYKFLNMEQKDDTETIKTQVLIHANLTANRMSSDVRHAFFQVGERTCHKDLVKLVSYLACCVDGQSKDLVIKIAEDMMVQRLKEWAAVQLGPDFFRRLILREADRCARQNSKPVGLFPNDFTQKMDLSDIDVDMKDGFTDLQQLSEILDRALSCGVWYINALTPGPRPDEAFMMTLIHDMISCVEKRVVTIDFAFYVMANFLMHLIIQYITDAPWNWSPACIESFVKLCHLCEERKFEEDRLRIRLADSVRKTKNVKVKVANLVSVYSIHWLAKSLVMDHSLMVYCLTLTRLVEAELITVETVFYKLTNARTNHHIVESSREMIDRVIYRVLTNLFADACDCKTCTPDRVLSLMTGFKIQLEDVGSSTLLEHLNTFLNT